MTDATYITEHVLFNEVIDIIPNGRNAADIRYPNPHKINKMHTNLTANKLFIEDDVIQYVENTYNNW